MNKKVVYKNTELSVREGESDGAKILAFVMVVVITAIAIAGAFFIFVL